MKYNLGFIYDKDFFAHVKAMVSRLTVAMNLKKFSKNSHYFDKSFLWDYIRR